MGEKNLVVMRVKQQEVEKERERQRERGASEGERHRMTTTKRARESTKERKSRTQGSYTQYTIFTSCAYIISDLEGPVCLISPAQTFPGALFMAFHKCHF